MPPAGKVVVTISANAASYSAAIDGAKRKMRELSNETVKSGHSTVSTMQASSAALRGLENGFGNNLRAAERFAASIPGLSKVLTAAFPLIGGLAFGSMIVDTGQKVYEFIKATNEMPRKINDAFRELTASSEMTNDKLRVTNDRLESEIAKLEHKPQNNLALGLDEARVKADELFASVSRSNTAVNKLLEENKVTALGAMVTGQGGTADVAGSIKSYTQDEGDILAKYKLAVHNNDATLAADLLKQYHDKQQSALGYAQSQIASRTSGEGYYGKQGGNLSALYGFAAQQSDEIDNEHEQNRNDADVVAKAKLDSAKAAGELAKQQAAQQVETMRAEIAAAESVKLTHYSELEDEANFWALKAAAAKKGSALYLAEEKEIDKAIGKAVAENPNLHQKFDELSAQPIANQDLSKSGEGHSEFASQGREAVEYLRNLRQSYQETNANAEAIYAADIRLGESTGTLSKHDAALREQTLHTTQYTEALNELQAGLKALAGLDDLDSNNKRVMLQGQLGSLNTKNTIQSASDNQAISESTIGGATTNAVNVMVQDWTDMTRAISTNLVRTVDSLNDDLVKAMMGEGKKGDFGKTLKTAGSGLLKTGLQGIEGSALKALGFGGGKADGSASNPFHVIMGGVGSAGSALSSAAGGLLSKAGGWLSGLLKSIPGFANGGDVLPNHPMMVGEHGPEIWNSGPGGHVTPNSMIGAGGGHTIHVDARGSSDPAATEAAVRRGVRSAVSQSVKLSAKSSHQASLRTVHDR